MRFHSLNRLSCTLTSNCSIVTPSAPAAPPLLFTFNHAAQISRLGMSCDLPCNLGSLMRLLPMGWSHSSAWTAPPLRSPPHCDTQVDHSYYGRVRRRPRIGTQPLTDSAAWSSPSHPGPPGVVSGPAFTRSVREPRPGSCCLYAGPHLGSKRVSPRLIPRQGCFLGFEIIYGAFDT